MTQILLSPQLTITKSYCHYPVIQLFRRLITNPNQIFFGLTSDIDNLGMFVAQYGRAKAQNIVDYYTNILIDYIYNSQKCIDTEDVVFIPAGEEVSVFALVDDNIVAQMFIDGLRRFVNHKINNIDIILTADTHITFGGKTLCQPEFRQKIKTFIRK